MKGRKLVFNSVRELTVVMRACFQSGNRQSHLSAGDIIDKIIISMESAIQERPVTRDSLTWKGPKPVALTA